MQDSPWGNRQGCSMVPLLPISSWLSHMVYWLHLLVSPSSLGTGLLYGLRAQWGRTGVQPSLHAASWEGTGAAEGWWVREARPLWCGFSANKRQWNLPKTSAWRWRCVGGAHWRDHGACPQFSSGSWKTKLLPCVCKLIYVAYKIALYTEDCL